MGGGLLGITIHLRGHFLLLRREIGVGCISLAGRVKWGTNEGKWAQGWDGGWRALGWQGEGQKSILCCLLPVCSEIVVKNWETCGAPRGENFGVNVNYTILIVLFRIILFLTKIHLILIADCIPCKWCMWQPYSVTWPLIFDFPPFLNCDEIWAPKDVSVHLSPQIVKSKIWRAKSSSQCMQVWGGHMELQILGPWYSLVKWMRWNIHSWCSNRGFLFSSRHFYPL